MYVPLRPPAAAAAPAVAGELRQRLQRLAGVRWVAVNLPLGAVVAAVDAPGPGDDELVDVVSQVESAHGVTGRVPGGPWSGCGERRAAVLFAADVVAAPVAVATQLVRRAPLPPEVGALVSFVDVQPRLRRLVERAVGDDATDILLGAVGAATQAVSGGTVGIAVDGAARLLRLREARRRLDAWQRLDATLHGPDFVDAQGVDVDRPAELPPGPVERYLDRVGIVAGVAFAATLASARGPRRAVDVALAATPKAAVVAREAFAATVGAALARRDAVVTDPSVLRRLDRVDTVVIDTDVLTTGRLVLGAILPIDPDIDLAELTAVAHRLHTAASGVGGLTGYRLGPLTELRVRGPTGEPEAAELERRGAVAVVGIAYGDRLVAVAGMAPEPADAADVLAAATRRAGLPLLAAPGDAGAPLPSADRVVIGADRLVATVRGLQADGAGVLLVSARRRALAAADCGIGVARAGEPPPWGAHVLVGDDLRSAALVIEAAGVAPRVTRTGVMLARAAAGLGATMALAGRAPRLSARGLLAVNGAAAVAVAVGWWQASELSRRPPTPPISRTPWHAMDARTVLAAVGSAETGLTPDEVAAREANDAVAAPSPSLPRSFVAELANPLTPILFGGAALSAAVGAVTDAVIVVAVTAVSGLVGGVQRWSTDRAVADLLMTTANASRVRRAGVEQMVAADCLVDGDVVSLVAGDVVPADCRIFDATALEMDESSLTGESLPVAKTPAPVLAHNIAERTSMLYEGTTVAAGRAHAVVVARGTSTEAGRSLLAARGAAPVSGVEARLAQLTRTTLPIALGSAAAVVGAGLLRRRPVGHTIGAGVGLAVASVPEGLPFLVSAAQLAAARRLAVVGALVRNPRTIEALGRTNVLCFDKTGTLTQGEISLSFVTDGGKRRASLPALTPELRPVLAAALRATPQPRAGQKLEQFTDRAVATGAEMCGVRRDAGAPAWRRVSALPFEPSRGYHATLARTATGPLLSVKGAPEHIVTRCVRDAHGVLTERRQRRLLEHADRLAGDGNRVLAVAERTHPGAAHLSDDDVTELRFLGLLALADPVRISAAPSVRQLREAGVQVVMITGDHPRTAESVARELDVLNSHRVITGAEIDALDDEALDALLPDIAVVARGTPAHKVRVVQGFQRLGRTVAMTGDGANDAPAIRLADVGIALGRRGTAAARTAADLVVTDDRLETILSALIEGRAMWASVRKALGILLGGNLGEVAFTLFGAVTTGSSPLTARQLLLVNLLTDLAPAMAVALRPPPVADTATLLAEGPEVSLGVTLTDEIIVRATATTLGATSAWVGARMTGRRSRARTVALAALVGTQLGQTLLAGGASPSVVAASIGSAASLVAIVQTPGVSHFFGCRPLGPLAWSIAATSAIGATAGSLVLPPLARAARRVVVDVSRPSRPTRVASPARSPDVVEEQLGPAPEAVSVTPVELV